MRFLLQQPALSTIDLMQLVFDNIIFSMERAGGVAIYWYELLYRLLRDQHHFTAIEQAGAHDNIFRRQLELPPERLLKDVRLPVKLLRYLPPVAKVPARAIF